MLIDLNTILYYLSKGYEVTKDELFDLSLEDIYFLIKRYPYTVAIIIKYGTTDAEFEGRLPVSRMDDCFYCGKDLWKSIKYEILAYSDTIVEFACEPCIRNRTGVF